MKKKEALDFIDVASTSQYYVSNRIKVGGPLACGRSLSRRSLSRRVCLTDQFFHFPDYPHMRTSI